MEQGSEYRTRQVTSFATGTVCAGTSCDIGYGFEFLIQKSYIRQITGV